MPTAEEKANQRIPFGKNGIKDGNGNVIRTDHMTMGDVINDIVDGGPSRQEMIDKRIKRAVDGELSAIDQNKALQDAIAGNTRRKA